MGATGDFGSNPNSLQLSLMLLSLKDRISRIRDLITRFPDSFLIVRFEDLVEDTDLVISRVNRFLLLKGFPSSFINSYGADELFLNSRMNIGIGKHWIQHYSFYTIQLISYSTPLLNRLYVDNRFHSWMMRWFQIIELV